MAKGAVYRPVDEVDLGPDSDEPYVHAKAEQFSRMAGRKMMMMTWLLEAPFIGAILLFFLKKINRIPEMISLAELQEDPVFVPLHPYRGIPDRDAKCLEPDMSPPDKVQEAVDCLKSPEVLVSERSQLDFRRWTILDYARAYTSGRITPEMVARRFLAFLGESSSESLRMSFFISIDEEDIRKQAMESSARYQKGQPLSVLDGVPIAIKDEIDCLPYPTTGGTTWMHKVRHCKNDACCVSRLRSCGAVIVGKTNMHEPGAGISGINPHYGAVRNPYDISKVTGGSSSGSAAVVAAGLCPVALGVDGAGSVRVPAALCGVIGLKPTFARIPTKGVLPLSYTVAMVGILAATVEDALIVYAAISGEASPDCVGATVPKIGLPLLKSANHKSFDIKMAKYTKWFDDCSDDIRLCCSNAVEKLARTYGWKVVEATIPDIEAMRLSHIITIGSECYNYLAAHLPEYKAEMGWDSRMALAIYGSYSNHEYINAQRIRNRQLEFHKKILSEVDIIVAPTVGATAYTIQDDAVETGELDNQNGVAFVRYQAAGNFLGLPAVTVPVGYDRSGLPIGLQFVGKPWSESLLIHVASALQEICMSGYKKPEVFYDMLGK
ncbi:fatty acid amide hydrolase-like [Andrographis paniculata]|uniref:fatty acid amide hydrolase-like n=1 Tax=Andrographis paniculata TaxID=175694 RepID=UPI0021E6F37B|nr:fatty acid amide hydrolase-like [Andrographis paniculata]